MSEYITVGTVLGDRYEILEKIGCGGMAYVYKAHCRVLNRNVAIKVLRQEFTGDAAFMRRFVTEAQAAAAISHANIVAVYDVCSEGELNYIVLELIEGVTLKEYIEKHGPLAWKDAVNFELQICAALECAHKNNIIHQDIKPQNMLITQDGTLKVTDFGIARATGSSTTVAGEAEGAVGSVHYCSPEQARGGFTDEKSDIYSAGVVFYEMLTGHVPFDADTPVAVAMKHMQEDVKPVTEELTELPKDLDKIIAKSVNREKRGRYASAADMIRDLNYLLEGVSVDSSVSGEGEDVSVHQRRGSQQKKKTKKKGKLSKSDIWIILGSVFCALALVGGILVLFLSTGGTRNEVKVPSVLEYTQEEAEEILKKSKLKMEIEEIVYDTAFEEGIVVEQDPIADKTVQKGFRVKVRVSGGEAELKVPSVVNMPAEDAVEELESYGFKVTKRSQYSEDVPKDTVVRQKPESGSGAKKGDTVTIYVNDRVEEGVIPNLEGSTVAAAKTRLEEAGFELGSITEEESEAEKGTVIRQSPLAGTDAEKGARVNLVVSTGKKAEEKPSEPDIQTPPAEEVKVKTISIPVPQNKDTTQIRVVANGQTIHDATHSKSEGTFDLRVTGKNEATLEIFHDGVYKGTQKIKF